MGGDQGQVPHSSGRPEQGAGGPGRGEVQRQEGEGEKGRIKVREGGEEVAVALVVLGDGVFGGRDGAPGFFGE